MSQNAENVNESARLIVESTRANQEPRHQKNPYFFRNVEKMVAALNERAAVVTHGGQVRVVLLDRPLDPPLTFADAANKFATWSVDVGERVEPAFKIWKAQNGRREFHGIEFQPDLSKADAGKFNRFAGFAVGPVAGCCDLIRQHIREVICSGDAAVASYVERWCAHLFQRPAEKPKVALILRGAKQIGKSYLAEFLSDMIGLDYVAVLDDPAMLSARFNSDLATALLLSVEEGFWAGDRSAEGRWKNLISGRSIRAEGKYRDAGTVPSFCRILMTTNEDFVAPVSGQDVRYCVLDVSPHRHGDMAYFDALNEERYSGGRAAFLHYLLNLDLAGWNPQEVPLTAALADQARLALSPAEAWWASFLESGELPTLAEGGSSEEWPLDEALDIERSRLFESYREFAPGFRSPPTPAALGRFLANHCPSAGYVKVANPYNAKVRINAYRLPPRAQAVLEFGRMHPRVVLQPIEPSEAGGSEAPAPRAPVGEVVHFPGAAVQV